MDKSLDQLIKENPRKYLRNKGNNKKKANPVKRTKAAGKVVKAKSRVQPQKKGGKFAPVTKAGPRAGPKKGVRKAQSTAVVDARNTILAKNRVKITDARERLSQKKVDLRQKLGRKKENNTQKRSPLRSRQDARQRAENSLRSAPVHLTRTVFNNTTANRRDDYGKSPLQYRDIPAEPVYRDQYDMKRSSAAMDWEPMAKRTRVLDSRLGPKEYVRPHQEPHGHKIVIDNLHPTVTQEDIEELFGDIGPLAKAVLKRPGLGEVIYSHREDALRAVDVYHNRQLDGMPMQVALSEIRPEPQQIYRPPPSNSSRASGGKSHIQPDINTIHKALFNKAGSKSQVFTVTLPKKDY